MKKIFSIMLIAAIGLMACKTEPQKTEDQKVRERHVKDSVAAAEEIRVLKDTANYTSVQWIDSTSLDLGSVKKGRTVEVAFRFKNTGTRPLIITDVQPGCGCTVPEKPEQPFAPGEEGVIKAKFDSKNQQEGMHNKHINVTANTNPDSHYLTFKIQVTN